MTAKRKPRGAHARLDVLEAARRAQVDAVEDLKAAQVGAALSALDEGTQEDLRAWEAAQASAPAWARFLQVARRLQARYPASVHLARGDALAWCDALDAAGDGVPFPAPARLPDLVAYFGEEARACEAALRDLTDGSTLPRGVTLDEARQVFRYALAGWKLWAQLGRTLSTWGQG